MIESLGTIQDTTPLVTELRGAPNGSYRAFSFDLLQSWLPSPCTVALRAICVAERGDVHCILTADAARFDHALSVAEPGERLLERLASELGAAAINLSGPWMLDTVRIAKPWGAEVWYTGIEARGVCTVQGTPLPWLIALAGAHCLGNASPHVILLKILDPLPDAVYGDLYFEMHEHKTEVYVVTHVDRRAWPAGVGGIRFGFNQARLEQFVSLEGFKEAWLDSVNEYRTVRTEVDRAFDQFREQAGIGPHDVVSPALAEQWKRKLEPALNERERQCRQAMEAFTEMKPLEAGDVVRVPPFTPHSLQHGVRVVEFQTPHYERYILSFAQKVLTQDHWDTVEVIDKIDWYAPFDKTLVELEATSGWRLELVADFDAFEVRRLSIDALGTFRMALPCYAIVMAIDSVIVANGCRLEPEQACLVPAAAEALELSAAASGGLVLVATPKPVKPAAGP